MFNFSIRRALLTSALVLGVCGLASAGTITQTFTLPTAGASSTFWSAQAFINSYDYYASLSPSTDGVLNSIGLSYTWSSTATMGGTDANTGSTGTDSYIFESDTHTTLGSSGVAGISLNENTFNGVPLGNTSFGANGTGCQKVYTNQSNGQVMGPANCVDTNVTELGSGDGAALSATYNSGNAAIYAYFFGTSAPGGVELQGTASDQVQASGNANLSNATLGGVALESVTVTYNYSAPSSVPEPTTLFLMGTALVGCGLLRKRIKS